MKTFLTFSGKELKKWSDSIFKPIDTPYILYRIGISYHSLGLAAKPIDKRLKTNFLEQSILSFEKLNSESKSENLGSYIFQIYSLVELDDDKKINSIVEKVKKHKNKNLSLIYINLAFAYLNFKNDCKKVLEYSEKLKLNELPVETDRISQVYYRSVCHKKNKDLKNLKEDFLSLKKNTSEEVRTFFPEKIKKIEKMILDIEGDSF